MSRYHVPRWIGPVARAGFAAKGAIYVVVGVLAGKAALGEGGETTGAKGAIQEIGQQPFGQVMLVLLAIGLGCYAAWRILSAFVDAEGKGSDAKGLATRAGIFVSGLIHAGLAVAAVAALRGSGGSSGKAEGWTARLMDAPFGPWLVIGVGVAVGIAGIMQWVRAAKGSYRDKFNLDGAAASQREWIERAAKLGLAARGLVFLIIGFFLGRAGWQVDASEARGFGDALDTLARQPYGTWLLGITALGLVCYGIYCSVVAIYGHFNSADADARTYRANVG
ncbi:MAG: DUF1206 domain-containing protein [Spartobacteria bacterium]